MELFWVFIKRPLFKMKVNDNSLHNPELINHRHVSKIMRLVQNIIRSIFEDSKCIIDIFEVFVLNLTLSDLPKLC